MRCYGYRFKRGGAVTRDFDPPSSEEVAEAERRGWRPRKVVQLSLDEFLDRISKARAKLDGRSVMAAFVASVGGSAVHARQIPISFAWAGSVPQAIATQAVAADDYQLRSIIEIDYTGELVALALGGVWNEMPWRFLVDLEVAAAQGLPRPVRADWDIFEALIEVIGSQAPGTTPGQLEKILAAKKLLPKTDKYQRYGILQTLSEIGVMPNPWLPPILESATTASKRQLAERQIAGGNRSDIVLPLAGWRGEMRVDTARIAELFDRDAPASYSP